MKSVVIDKTWDGRRLTRFLQKAMPSAGMGQIRKFLRLGRIKAGGKRAGEETVLCGMTVTELSERLGVEVVPVPNDGYELCSLLLEKE